MCIRDRVGRRAAVGDDAPTVVWPKPAADEALILRRAADSRALEVEGPMRRAIEARVLDVDRVVRMAVDEVGLLAVMEVGVIDVQPFVALLHRPHGHAVVQLRREVAAANGQEMCIRDSRDRGRTPGW